MAIKATRPGGSYGEHPHNRAADKNAELIAMYGKGVKHDPNHPAYHLYDHGADTPYEAMDPEGA